MVRCSQCSKVFHVIGDALSAQLDTKVLLEMAARSIVEQFDLKACHFRLLSRDLSRRSNDVASLRAQPGAFSTRGRWMRNGAFPRHWVAKP